jgi:hypothetical protein
MVKVQASVEIERSPETVYRFMAEDFERNYPRWSPEVKALEIQSQGPLRVGTKAKQVRVDQGRRTESVFQITQMEPAQRLTFEGQSPSFWVDYRFEPNSGDRTRLTFTFELRRLELMMRPFEKLIQQAVQLGARRNVNNLKRLIEADDASAAA